LEPAHAAMMSSSRRWGGTSSSAMARLPSGGTGGYGFGASEPVAGRDRRGAGEEGDVEGLADANAGERG
jgi:hypothetical protein